MGLRKRLALGLAGLALATVAGAVVPDGLYEAVVAGDGTSGGRAAAAVEALKQVAVRVTGRRAAASEPALAAVYAAAPGLAASYRAVAAGQVAVGFDAAALDAALRAAGQPLWPRDRAATLVLLVGERAGAPASAALPAVADLRRELERAARTRGLPLAWPAGPDAGAPPAWSGDALAGRLEPLRGLARQFGADAVLLGRAGATGTVWSWLGSVGTGTLGGTAAEAIDALADRYGAAFAIAAGGAGTLSVVIHGVRDLVGYAAATEALAGLAGVREVTLEEAVGETLRYRLAFGGDRAALVQAAQASRLVPDETAPPDEALHFVLRP